jgi:hypothetical protein
MGPVEALDAGVLVGFISASKRVPDGLHCTCNKHPRLIRVGAAPSTI